ncbi:MAG: hypothetical protein IKK08_13235, partial [Clostridia bacterium]|nr:hypothetical protein [Clostridia bacterium]
MMNQNQKNTAQRVFAALLSVLMLLSQLVLPAAAFAAVDVSTLPLLTVGYTDLDGELCTLSVAPAATGVNMDEVVYWAQLPGNANWETPVTLTALSQDGNVCMPDGTAAYPGVNATEKDGSSYTGWVEIYTPEEMNLIATYPIYLSTLPLPEEPEPVAASVNVYYVNTADNSVLLTDTKTDLAAGEHWISPDRAGEVSGYDLVSSDAQLVTVYADGTISGDVYFQMQAKPVYASVNVYYVNTADNSVLLTDTKTDLAAGEHWISPDRAGEVSGYDLVSSDAQLVTVYADGTISGDVYFQMQAKPVYANVNVYYVNTADNSVLLTDTKT